MAFYKYHHHHHHHHHQYIDQHDDDDVNNVYDEALIRPNGLIYEKEWSREPQGAYRGQVEGGLDDMRVATIVIRVTIQ